MASHAGWHTWPCVINHVMSHLMQPLDKTLFLCEEGRCRSPGKLLMVISRSSVTSKSPFTMLLSQHNQINVTLCSRGQENTVEMTIGKQNLFLLIPDPWVFKTHQNIGEMYSILMDFSSCVCWWVPSSILWKIIPYFCVNDRSRISLE